MASPELDLYGSGEFEQRIEDALVDPLYQLLVQHVLFCRLAERTFAQPSRSSATGAGDKRSPTAVHRSKRRPAN